MGEEGALAPSHREVLGRLESEYQVLAGAVRRIAERLEAQEDRVALRSEVTELKARVGGLQAQIKAIEDRLTA